MLLHIRHVTVSSLNMIATKKSQKTCYSEILRSLKIEKQTDVNKCESCFCKMKDFKPVIGQKYVCLQEFEVFENIMSLNGNKAVCFWDNPAFKQIKRGG